MRYNELTERHIESINNHKHGGDFEQVVKTYLMLRLLQENNMVIEYNDKTVKFVIDGKKDEYVMDWEKFQIFVESSYPIGKLRSWKNSIKSLDIGLW